jgi:hypothetical protein
VTNRTRAEWATAVAGSGSSCPPETGLQARHAQEEFAGFACLNAPGFACLIAPKENITLLCGMDSQTRCDVANPTALLWQMTLPCKQQTLAQKQASKHRRSTPSCKATMHATLRYSTVPHRTCALWARYHVRGADFVLAAYDCARLYMHATLL